MVPESSLPPEIVLHEGKITCVTCHGNNPHLGQFYAMENRDSALCRGCHLK
ncbi:cytochrome c3 family protein [Desulfuromonas sp. TF]|uniref:cytochrome c3 family protein n=1 Tax=Desulfuromonas sp. TF TaxID=1232410 RepID=UPI0003FE1F27|nr:cytochrome c3 family protein [Desulfuromonas sp. TF]